MMSQLYCVDGVKYCLLHLCGHVIDLHGTHANVLWLVDPLVLIDSLGSLLCYYRDGVHISSKRRSACSLLCWSAECR